MSQSHPQPTIAVRYSHPRYENTSHSHYPPSVHSYSENTPSPSALHSLPNPVLIPSVSVDKVRVHLPIHHSPALSGHYTPHSRWYEKEPFWLNVGKGKAAVRSRDSARLCAEFNPNTIASGSNLALYSEPLLESCVEVLKALCRVGRGVDRRENWTRVRSGCGELSVLHLCSDWLFPTRVALDGCMRELRTKWHWWPNKKREERFVSSYYLLHARWDFVAYCKSEESGREELENRLRLEIRIRRADLRALSGRLGVAADLSMVGEWEEGMYRRVWEYYVGRIRAWRDEPHALPCMVAQWGGRPAWAPTPFPSPQRRCAAS